MLVKNSRKWLALLIAVALYYIVHEGAHMVVALLLGTFQRISFVKWGLGMQIVAENTMTNMQIFVFSIMGAVATLIVGYIMVWQRNRILMSTSKLLRAIAYYATLIFLCLDPLYFSIISRFVGGGDLNGIILIGIPKTAAVSFFLMLLVLNLFIFLKIAYPSYKQKFNS